MRRPQLNRTTGMHRWVRHRWVKGTRAFRRLLPVVLLAAGCIGSIGCGRGGDAERLVLTGSSTLAPLVGEIGKRYEMAHPQVRIDVQTGGSSRGIADVASGLSDLGLSSRDLTADEAKTRRSRIVARDGVAFIVHRSNPVSSLTREELRQIFRGQSKNWRTFGGEDRGITVVNRAEGRSELKLVRGYLGLDRGEIQATLLAGETQQALKSVIGDPSALTYLSLGSAEFEVERGGAIRLLPLDGVPATSLAVADGRYPLQRPLLFVIPAELSQAAHAFLEFACSPEHEDLVRRHAFVPAE